MKNILLVLLATLVLVGGGYMCLKKFTFGRNPPVATKNTAKKYLALGDSYTIGQGVSEQARWVRQIAPVATAILQSP